MQCVRLSEPRKSKTELLNCRRCSQSYSSCFYTHIINTDLTDGCRCYLLTKESFRPKYVNNSWLDHHELLSRCFMFLLDGLGHILPHDFSPLTLLLVPMNCRDVRFIHVPLRIHRSIVCCVPANRWRLCCTRSLNPPSGGCAPPN